MSPSHYKDALKKTGVIIVAYLSCVSHIVTLKLLKQKEQESYLPENIETRKIDKI